MRPAGNLGDAFIARRWADVRARVRTAAARADRNPDEISVVGACKQVPAARIQAAISAGLRALGENRVQELEEHRRSLAPVLTAHPDVEFHFIGHLQSNKAERAATYCTMVHSMDRTSVAKKLNNAGKRSGVAVKALLQINISGEESKSGVEPNQAEHCLRKFDRYEYLDIVGLMTIPAPSNSPEALRPSFRRMRQLRDDLNRRASSDQQLSELSMGMSSDFEVAIEEGATIIRVGTAIFGPRPG